MADSRDFPDEFTKTMLLLRLLTFLNHGFAVASQPPYRIDEAVPSEMPPLESAAALLVMDMQVLAACYRSAAQYRVVTATTVSDLDTPMDNDSISAVSPQYLSQFIIVPNPESYTNPIEGSNPHELRLADLTTATDFWPKIQSDMWYFASNSVPISLESHAKTVAAYLNCYKNASSADQENHGRHFFAYILTACWKKMHARISSWPAVGLVFGLHSVLVSLHVLIDTFNWEKLPAQQLRGDRTLAHVMISNAASLSFVMQNLESKYQSISKLLQVARSSVDSETNHPIYSKQTAYEFHCFVLAIFIGFARSLKQVKDYPKLKKAGQSLLPQITYFQVLGVYARLLTSIISSASFANHLHVLNETEYLAVILPTFRKARFYMNFATQNKMCFKYGFVTQKKQNTEDGNTQDVEERAEGDDKAAEDDNEAAEGDNEAAEGDDEAAEGDDEAVEGDDEAVEGDDGAAEEYQKRDVDIAAVLRWINTFVVHFLAKRTLEKHSAQFPNEEVSFSIIKVNRSRSVVSASWADMEAIITAALPPGEDAEAVISCLKGKIETNLTGSSEKAKVVEIFQSMIAGKEIVMPARLHAEVVLLTLGSEECRATAIVNGDENLRRLCDEINRHSPALAVSKPCCPACALFFKVWKDDLEERQVSSPSPIALRGHSIIFPVELPQWTPQRIFQSMICQFRPYIQVEINLMVHPPSSYPQRAWWQGHKLTQSNASNVTQSTNQLPSLNSEGFSAMQTVALHAQYAPNEDM